MYTAKIIQFQKVENHILVDVDFIEGENVTREVIKVTEKSDLDNQIRRRLQLFNQLDTEITKIKVGDWVAPVEVTKVIKELTPEEIKAQEITQKEMELNALAEQVKKEKELTTLAIENAEIKAKLDELETLKTK